MHKVVDSSLEHEAALSQEVIYQASTMFPFTLFPDTITIDRVKATVTRRWFFGVANVTSIQIQDILNIEANRGPFFGSLKIWTRFFTDEPLKINYLSQHHAMKIKSILQGYVISFQNKIDTSNIPREELLGVLSRLGAASGRAAP